MGLWRSPVDLVGKQEIGEDRTLAQHEAVMLTVKDVAAGDVPGKQVGCELDALEFHPQGPGERVGDQGLGQAGVILKQNVTSGREKGRHHQVEHLPFSDNGFLNFLHDPGRDFGDLFKVWFMGVFDGHH